VILLLLLPLSLAAGLAGGPLAPAGTLEPQFRPGDVRRYRVELRVTSETEGQRVEQIGAKAYATPFSFSSSEKLTWQVTRRVAAVLADGSAEIEELLEGFSPIEPAPPDAKEKTGAALKLALAEWTRPGRLALRYRESALGQVSGLPADAAPVFDQAPAVLSLWLRRALRPAASRPDHLQRRERWSESRSVELPPWAGVTGRETGAWLPGPLPQLGLVRFDNLHVVQQISGIVPGAGPSVPSGDARFHAESLATLAAAGGVESYGGAGAMMQATRSATREMTRVLDAVPGLPERPRFRAALTAHVQISREDWPPK